MMQTQFTSSKSVKLEHNTWAKNLILKLEQVSFHVPKVEKQERQFI